ncbi:DUF2280 domain-containing protein [Xanthobacter flavus]|uniref:DUF2280 domain-containing protein n=1 Tax=Xanthobacter flavus TaxID=281 RepID=UPI0037286A9A
MVAGKLTDEVRTFVVQSLACFDPPSVVVAAVKKEYGEVVKPQAVEAYDPTKRAGRNLSKRWRALFEETRKAFLEDTSKIAISHRAVRLRALQRMAEKAESMGNMALAAQLHEQAAKECGDAYTNRRQISGPNGGPVEVVASTMTAKEAADAYASTINGD